MPHLTRRAVRLGTAAVAGGLATRALSPQTPSMAGISPVTPTIGDRRLNDASGLSETPIHRHTTLTQSAADPQIETLRARLKDPGGRPVSPGAARHSMGGQAIPRDGRAITFLGGDLELDTAAQTCSVSAGMRWAEVIARLDPAGISPKVMQSTNDFWVSATFSVNAHGWAVPHGPMGSTVRSIAMLLPDGTLLTAPRTASPGLFRAAMGGDGLIGLITALKTEVAPNQRLTPTFTGLQAADFAPAFMTAIADPAVSMAYGRLNLDRARFFQDALLITCRATDDQSDLPPAAGSGFVSNVSRRIFRAQLGNERAKPLRRGGNPYRPDDCRRHHTQRPVQPTGLCAG